MQQSHINIDLVSHFQKKSTKVDTSVLHNLMIMLSYFKDDFKFRSESDCEIFLIIYKALHFAQ